MENKILIIDDEKNILSILSDILKDAGYSVFTAGTGEEGLKILKKEDINLLFLDVRLPDANGIDLLKQIKKEEPAVEVIMISGHATIDIAIQATKLGAYDFIEKPLSLERVKIAVTHAMEKTNLVKEKDELIKINTSGYEILGESKAIKYIKSQIEKCAPSDSKVLILGETGTGKELVATAIHTQSTRKTASFIKVNCASIPESLIESELLGHEKGAFTGAVSRKIGKFELADKGTIFLDEIGDMGLSCQAKVLRVLENGEFERVGGLTSIKVDVRIVAATNKD
ncbi:MAG: sigma-54 dependent transcriptional regulator, partial [bacterium]|nr:sigma-54 dependent transcriptional regulator [bacterium]